MTHHLKIVIENMFVSLFFKWSDTLASIYCKSTKFRCSKISRVQQCLGDSGGFPLLNPIYLICDHEIRDTKSVAKFSLFTVFCMLHIVQLHLLSSGQWQQNINCSLWSRVHVRSLSMEGWQVKYDVISLVLVLSNPIEDSMVMWQEVRQKVETKWVVSKSSIKWHIRKYSPTAKGIKLDLHVTGSILDSSTITRAS